MKITAIEKKRLEEVFERAKEDLLSRTKKTREMLKMAAEGNRTMVRREFLSSIGPAERMRENLQDGGGL